MRVSMAAGFAASLDAGPAPGWDGRSHKLRAIYGHEPDLYALCVCGERIDGADRVQLRQLVENHATTAAVSDVALAEARETTRRRSPDARRALAEGTARKAGS